MPEFTATLSHFHNPRANPELTYPTELHAIDRVLARALVHVHRRTDDAPADPVARLRQAAQRALE